MTTFNKAPDFAEVRLSHEALGIQVGSVATTLPDDGSKNVSATFPRPYLTAPLVYLTNNVNAGSIANAKKLHVYSVSRDWAVTKVGCRYSQARLTQESILLFVAGRPRL